MNRQMTAPGGALRSQVCPTFLLLHRHAARKTNQRLQVLPHRCWLTSIITC